MGDFLLAPASDQPGKKILEILRHGWEMNPGYGQDRQ